MPSTNVLTSRDPGAARSTQRPRLLHSAHRVDVGVSTAPTATTSRSAAGQKSSGVAGSPGPPRLPAAATTTISGLTACRSSTSCCMTSREFGSSAKQPSDRFSTCTPRRARVIAASATWLDSASPVGPSARSTQTPAAGACWSTSPAMNVPCPTSSGSVGPAPSPAAGCGSKSDGADR